ncbi:MAG: adenylate/guanylate cyclase domain-containing protein [Desulfovibrio sp.]|nr:adenylate/guanylate cyclase domain-containing protein [Desulfovibrio sp.]
MKKPVRTALVILALTIIAGTAVSLLFAARPRIAERLNNIVYDAWLLNTETKAAERGPAVIDVDEASLNKIGQLPWPRTVLAELVEILLNSGASAVGLDTWLTEPDRSSPIAVDSQLERTFGINLDFSRIPPAALDNDRYFRDSIKDKPVALGGLASFAGGDGMPERDLPAPAKIIDEIGPGAPSPRARIPEMTDLIPPLPIFTRVAPMGLLNVSLSDGVVRAMPLLAKNGDDIYPGLSLLTLMTALGEDTIRLESREDGLEAIRIGPYRAGVDKDGSFRPQYLGPARSLPYFSAIDVLEGRVGRDELEGRLLFIGSSAHSLLNLRSTPYDSATPGAEIHATIVDNILAGESVRAPHHDWGIRLFAIYFSAALGATIFLLLSPLAYAAISCAALAVYIGGSWILFQYGLFVSPISSAMALLLAGAGALLVRYKRELSEKRKIRRAFGQYVSPEVVSQIVSEGDRFLKGEHKEVTIMFTDARDFTAISEKLSPGQLVRLLNCYFTPMTARVIARHGTLDKFIGDALMAFWNAPLNVPDHPREATRAALEMQTALAGLRPALAAEFGIDMRMGIGIHSGWAHVGNMGSRDLLDYTCVGENVNLASRLEGLCKRYGMEIVVSETVRRAGDDAFFFLPLDQIRVKGSAKPLRVYSPFAAAPDPDMEKPWNEALTAYFAGDFARARDLFGALDKYPLLRIARRLFADRCEKMAASPARNWDGVWTYTDK